MPPRMLDLQCSQCGAEVNDLFVRSIPLRVIHMFCGGEMEQVYRPPRRDAQWSERDAVVVFKKPDGSISYPGRNDARLPNGCERIELRSMAAVRQFEREHNVISHIAHYDQGSGNAIDDKMPTPRAPNEDERYRRFRESTRGIF